MMLDPPEISGDDEPGRHYPCPQCCSVWWVVIAVIDETRDVAGYIDKAKCVNCEYELNLEESEV
jgi:hypothetical protein